MGTPLPEISPWYDYDPETGVGNSSTPIKASRLNAWSGEVRDVAQEAVDRAEAAADQAQTVAESTTDTLVRALLLNAASTTRIAADALYAPRNLRGTYAARPAANSVLPGTHYYCSNVPETYRSDGSAWVVVGSAGQELGYAQSTTLFQNNTTTPQDIPALTTTFVVGERPIEVRFDGDYNHDVGGGIVVLYLVVDGTVIARPNGPAFSAWHTISRRARLSGLTPGTTHTAKVQMAAIGGNGKVQGDATNPMSISVVTL